MGRGPSCVAWPDGRVGVKRHDVLLLLALCAVVAGVAWIYPPAGLCAAGVALGAVWWLFGEVADASD